MNRLSKIASLSVAALALSAGVAAAQVPGFNDGGDPSRRQLRQEQRQEQRMERRMERQIEQPSDQGGLRDGIRADRAQRQLEEERTGSTLRFDRVQRRDRDERVIIRERDRGPTVRFGFREPDVFVRTLAPTYRYVVVGGERCRVTITRRVNRNGRLVTSESRKCPGRPEIVIRTRQ